MNDAMLSLLTGLVSGALSAVVTYFATFARARLDLSVEYDRELREKRLVAYQQLWTKLKPLARYSAERPLTHALVRQTAEGLRDWYFDLGGIYLSRDSRDPYFELKQAMQDVIDDRALQATPDAELRADRVAPLLECGTRLRASLSDDIGTRRRSFV